MLDAGVRVVIEIPDLEFGFCGYVDF